jgi:N-acetylglutamate synthase
VAISICDLEEAAALGWRAPEEAPLGRWRLRAAEGYTGRANSALAVGDPGMPLAAAIAEVCRWYSDRGLPPMVAVPFPVGRPHASTVDRFLAELGWPVRAGGGTGRAAAPARVTGSTAAPGGGTRSTGALGAGTGSTAAPGGLTVMTATPAAVTGLTADTAVPVDVEAEPDDGWLALHRFRGQKPPPISGRLLMSAPWQAFASVREAGRTIAIGRVAAGADWAGLTAVEVDPRHRRRGLGRGITAALAAAAAARGAAGLYLQVENHNADALRLYDRAGFAAHHEYHYRVAG